MPPRPSYVPVLDFGAQYAHLICRRIRELHVYSDLLPHNISLPTLLKKRPNGLILSGSPASIYDPHPPAPDPRVYNAPLPLLGICYGLQLIVHHLGGHVARVPQREYGKAHLHITSHTDLFHRIPNNTVCWMSHGDAALQLPAGFESIAETENAPYAAIRNRKKKIYAVQFHPEVTHTARGRQLLANFLFNLCKCKPTWKMTRFIAAAVKGIKRRVGRDHVLCALSGGVDSMTTAALVRRAVGPQLTCVFVNHGLLRENEPELVRQAFQDHFRVPLIYADATPRFLTKLRGVTDPEEKRQLIGEEFIHVFTEQAQQHGPFQWLAQGTLYPDVIESAAGTGPAARIKSHHNVAAIPGWTTFKLLEPLRDLYKDEVRKIANLLGLPRSIIDRHPFPGPGLAVRIIGEVTAEKLWICRSASRIVEEELQRAGWYTRVWQAFAVVGDDKAVGVLGDARTYGYVVTVRVVDSLDAMTADWSRLPHRLLGRISSRITNEVAGVTLVTYAVSSKPPATIEPQ